MMKEFDGEEYFPTLNGKIAATNVAAIGSYTVFCLGHDHLVDESL